MNDYMRENKLEPLVPQLNPETVAQAADGESRKSAARNADKDPDKAVATERPADRPRAKDSGSVTHEKPRKSDS